ncbi:MAG TPA: hypothetical protein PK588_04740 [Paludibacteraceae bacterium]|nr:hypothetical protein [Paludibacteraceae bacterium]HQF50068.1 hypothetical protein [Paludibacteraceae bacterium]
MTDAYYFYRQYYTQSPDQWDKIRWNRFQDTDDYEVDSIVFANKKLTAPTKRNVRLFYNMDQMNQILDAVVDSSFSGYIVYPYWMEFECKLTEMKVVQQRMTDHGFMNMLASSISDSVEIKIDSIVSIYIDEGLSQNVSSESMDKWIEDNSNRNLYNLKSYFIYVENKKRPNADQTTEVNKTLQMETDSLVNKLKNRCPYVVVPYWKTNAYKRLMQMASQGSNRFMIRRNLQYLAYLGYVIDPQSGMPLLNTSWGDSLNSPFGRRKYDLMVMVTGTSSTDSFLVRSDCWKTTIKQIFNYPAGVVNDPGIIGVNFYFPDYSFEEKKAMTQFVKTVSLVVDSFRVKDKGLVYGDKKMKNGNKDLNLFLTFSRKMKEEHYDFIQGLQGFVDGIYYVDFDESGIPYMKEEKEKENLDYELDSHYEIVYDSGITDTSSFVSRMINPFYLLRIPYECVDEVSSGNLNLLVDCDYDSGRWGVFLTIEVILILLLISYFVLTNYSTEIYALKTQFNTFFVLLLITLVAESIVFFIFMLEALSPQRFLFAFKENSMIHLTGIFLPILPMVIYFLVRKLAVNKRIP